MTFSLVRRGEFIEVRQSQMIGGRIYSLGYQVENGPDLRASLRSGLKKIRAYFWRQSLVDYR